MSLAANGQQGDRNAFVELADSGQVLPAVPNFYYRIYGFIISNTLAANVKFQSAATDISLTMKLPATGGIVAPAQGTSYFKTAVGEPLNLNSSVATAIGVQVIYDLVN